MKYRQVLVTTDDDGQVAGEFVYWEAETFAGWWCSTCDGMVRTAEDVWIGDVAATICGDCGAERHVEPEVGIQCPFCREDVRNDDFLDHVMECGND